MRADRTPDGGGAFARDRPGGCTILVRVVPRAGRTAVAGTRGGALVVRLAAAPVDGEANVALIGFLAGTLRVPRRKVHLVSGDRSRDKRLDVEGVDATTATALLARPSSPGFGS